MSLPLRRADPRESRWLRSYAGRAVRTAYESPKRLAAELSISERHARRICEDGGTVGRAFEALVAAPNPEPIIAAAMIAVRRKAVRRMTDAECDREYREARKAAADVAATMARLLASMDDMTPAQQADALASIGEDMVRAGVRLAATAQRKAKQ